MLPDCATDIEVQEAGVLDYFVDPVFVAGKPTSRLIRCPHWTAYGSARREVTPADLERRIEGDRVGEAAGGAALRRAHRVVAEYRVEKPF
jgi:hypothetical protein